MLGALTWLGSYIYQGLQFFFKALEKMFGPVLARSIPLLFPVIFALNWAIGWVIGRINTCLGYLQTIHLPNTNLNGLTSMGLINTFFPLTEMFGLLTIYLTVLGVLNGYRLLKSWIPTLS